MKRFVYVTRGVQALLLFCVILLRIRSSTGMVDTENFALVSKPGDPNPPHPNYVRETVVAPFFCVKGCGGKVKYEDDINQYEFGVCVSMNRCKCHKGYSGPQCKKTSCRCKNAFDCDRYNPDVCRCYKGWTGPKCGKPICEPPCLHGKCIGPYTCHCDTIWIGSSCSTSWLVAVIVTMLSLMLCSILSYYIIRRVLKRKASQVTLKNLSWHVKWEDVGEAARAVSFVCSLEEDSVDRSANAVTWRFQMCYMQKFNIDTLNVKNYLIREEIGEMKALKHPNIIRFVGACLDAPNVCVLIDFCSKGSLEDILSNESVKFGWDFRFSILKDICRGMNFIHNSSLESHGRLKSRNCLIDNKWTCKIAGHGFPTMRYDAPRLLDPEHIEIEKISVMFWTAPELLRKYHFPSDVRCGTKMGDVYSFAIILAEVMSREEPYSTELSVLEPEDIINLLIHTSSSRNDEAKEALLDLDIDIDEQFRPSVDATFLPEDNGIRSRMIQMQHEAWHEDPDIRPSFKTLLKSLNEIYPLKGNLIDNLVKMLEKYSSNLEKIVTERTQELEAEKQKTELLISQMLPKKVLEDLKHGRKVSPESFHSVTIFFSDIVGFTSIARDSTPLQVVELLNDLYTTFDEILDLYDVYKVETIGDAYMVVSGIPIRNGHLHAGEIATMSLHLLSSMLTFTIRHMPKVMLQLRIGMHSGPCVAGVVGLKMPRYCLFGDTVNIASRMEATSHALRIHMSTSSAVLLEKIGGYHLECRGDINIKGRGIMTTYWLMGKNGFTKPLPDMHKNDKR